MKNILMIMGLMVFSVVNAAPSATVKHLMNDQPSMLDWGIYQLQQELNSMDEMQVLDHPSIIGNYKIDGYVSYLWDTNKLLFTVRAKGFYKGVEMSVSTRSTEKESDLKLLCKETIKTVKSHLDIDHKTGKPKFDLDHSSVPINFMHSGYSQGNQPETLESDLDDIIVVKATVTGAVSYVAMPKFVKCQSDLLSTSVSYEEFKQ